MTPAITGATALRNQRSRVRVASGAPRKAPVLRGFSVFGQGLEPALGVIYPHFINAPFGMHRHQRTRSCTGWHRREEPGSPLGGEVASGRGGLGILSLSLAEESSHESAAQEFAQATPGSTPGNTAGPHRLDIAQNTGASAKAAPDLGDAKAVSSTHLGFSYWRVAQRPFTARCILIVDQPPDGWGDCGDA